MELGQQVIQMKNIFKTLIIVIRECNKEMRDITHLIISSLILLYDINSLPLKLNKYISRSYQ